VLLALPVLAGRRVELPEYAAWRSSSASDVPFFCWAAGGGDWPRKRAVSAPDEPPLAGLLVVPPYMFPPPSVPPAEPSLTSESQQNKIFSFQSQTWNRGGREPACNDF